MPRPFIPLSFEQFRALVAGFPFARTVTAVDLHHIPALRKSAFTGVESLEALYDAQVRQQGLSDLAQHVTIAPDGRIWTGRDWNQPPASAAGHNGNETAGPFMLALAGNFDPGSDVFEGVQAQTCVQVIATLQERFALSAESLRFHGQLSNGTCPGSSIDYTGLLDQIRAERSHSAKAPPAGEPPFSQAFQDDELNGALRAEVRAALDAMSAQPRRRDASSDAEPAERGAALELAISSSRGADSTRSRSLTTADRVALRPHVVNLNAGELARGGEFFTLPEDVTRIFHEDLERAYSDPTTVGMPRRVAGEPLRIMFWAHGGLISESAGLAIAKKHLEFWKRNGVYPIYFVWETGFLQTVGQLLRGLLGGTRGARNLFSDNISDPLLEKASRALGGEKIWSGMKRNAELASADHGGAALVASELQAFCARHAGSIELHAAGHSAGSIFHAHFLPRVVANGGPKFKSLHLLAPAVRVDTFKRRLLPLIGSSIEQASLFTMVKEQELDDNCAAIYRKSLLYMIRFALEKDSDAEILGLEECLRREREVAKLFGLAGATSSPGEVIFSPSLAEDGIRASRSTTHGGFDDDAPTMNSVALRVLGLSERSKLALRYPEGQRDLALDPWVAPELEELQRAWGQLWQPSWPPSWPVRPPGYEPVIAPPLPGTPAPGGRRARRALCVGIDRYPYNPLAGCVADARLWARTLGALGFECELLLDADATYDNIVARVERLITDSRAGDVIVWQYSGHGTQVPDLNGDEAGGDSPGQDEAICPVDLQHGRMLIDDDIAALSARVPAGVNLTMFLDCCHSGTLNRFGVGQPPSADVRDERPRFLPLSPELEQAYRTFAKARGRSRTAGARSRAAASAGGDVLFSACLSTEVAWESNGHGEFSLRATDLLSRNAYKVSNREFIDQVVRAFGARPRQTPNLSALSPASTTLLAPITNAQPPIAPPAGRGEGASDRTQAIEQVMRQLRELLV